MAVIAATGLVKVVHSAASHPASRPAATTSTTATTTTSATTTITSTTSTPASMDRRAAIRRRAMSSRPLYSCARMQEPQSQQHHSHRTLRQVVSGHNLQASQEMDGEEVHLVNGAHGQAPTA